MEMFLLDSVMLKCEVCVLFLPRVCTCMWMFCCDVGFGCWIVVWCGPIPRLSRYLLGNGFRGITYGLCAWYDFQDRESA